MSSDIWLPSLGYPKDPKHPFNKQWDIFNTRKRIVLASGSRKAGKTWSVLERVVRHLWETPGARVGVFAKSVKLAKDGGSWQDLTERTIPEWVEANIGLRYTTELQGVPGPKIDSITKTAYFRITNYWGGESECKLYSIDNDDEVASKVKNKSFSMIYFVELSMFKDPRILSITLPSLRIPHLKPTDGSADTNHQWLADTNPDEDLGNRSWFFDTFYTKRQGANKRLPNETDEAWADRQEYYGSMEVIEMFVQDNPYVTRQEVIELKMSCLDDQGLYDSYFLGIHGDGGQKRTKHFASLFNKNHHVLSAHEGEDYQLYINKNTTTLYTGWDIGSVSNHAAGIADIWPTFIDGRERSCFTIIDEHCSFEEHVKIYDYAKGFLDKMNAVERVTKKKYDWVHWSDDSALNVFRPTGGTFDYLEVRQATNDRVNLQGVQKPDGSVKTRVRLLRRLLRENRIFVLAHCVNVIAMLEECKKGDSEKEYVVWDVHKHTFDWVTYIIFQELLTELMEENRNPSESQVAEIIAVG